MLATQTRRPELSSLNSWKCWVHVATCLSSPELWLRKWRQAVPGQAGCSDQPSQEILDSDERPCLCKAEPDRGRLLKSVLGFRVPVCTYTCAHTDTHAHACACMHQSYKHAKNRQGKIQVCFIQFQAPGF